MCGEEGRGVLVWGLWWSNRGDLLTVIGSERESVGRWKNVLVGVHEGRSLISGRWWFLEDGYYDQNIHLVLYCINSHKYALFRNFWSMDWENLCLYIWICLDASGPEVYLILCRIDWTEDVSVVFFVHSFWKRVTLYVDSKCTFLHVCIVNWGCLLLLIN